jgi:hypothetical protein
MPIFRIREKLTAANLNLINGEWVAFTPAWTTVGAGADPTLGNGTLTAQYSRVGRNIDVSLRLVIGSTTTVGSGDWSLSLPVTPSATHANLETTGSCLSLCAGSYRHDVILISSGASTLLMIGVAAGSFYKSTTPGVWATGNFLNLAFTYKAAT